MEYPQDIAESKEHTEFRKLLKIGIYKELHKKGLLTDFQLDTLIKMQENTKLIQVRE